MAVALVWLTGCGGEHERPDPRLASPQTTVEGLFEAYGVAALEPAALEDRIRRGAPLHLADPETRARTFMGVPADDPLYEGYVGYVVANLARGRGGLRYQVVRADEVQILSDAAHGRPFPIIVVRTARGWQIDLHRSVPGRVREELREGAAELERKRDEETSALAPSLPEVPTLQSQGSSDVSPEHGEPRPAR